MFGFLRRWTRPRLVIKDCTVVAPDRGIDLTKYPPATTLVWENNRVTGSK